MSKAFTAQDLYDWREETGYINGTELHDLFRALLNGEPSPAGATPISVEALREVADEAGQLSLTQEGDAAREFLASKGTLLDQVRYG